MKSEIRRKELISCNHCRRWRRDLSSNIHANNITPFNLIKTRQGRSSVFFQDKFPEFLVTHRNTFVPNSPIAPIDDKISKMDPTNTYYTYLYREVKASVFTLNLDHLKVHSYYVVTVKACHEGEGDKCGTYSSFQILYTE